MDTSFLDKFPAANKNDKLKNKRSLSGFNK